MFFSKIGRIFVIVLSFLKSEICIEMYVSQATFFSQNFFDINCHLKMADK